MIVRTLFGLIALVPAALNTGPAAAGQITISLCAGDGQTRSISIPVGNEGPPGDHAPCHDKGCHAGGSRKRTHCQI